MATIQWKPEVNTLTVPQSYQILYLPRNVVGYEDLAKEIVKEHPNCGEVLALTVITALSEKIQEHLINGDQVTLTNDFTFSLSFTASICPWAVFSLSRRSSMVRRVETRMTPWEKGIS